MRGPALGHDDGSLGWGARRTRKTSGPRMAGRAVPALEQHLSAAGRGRRCHPAPRRFVKRHGTCPSARVSQRLVVRAIWEMEGAQEVRTSVPVPAGGP